MVIKVDDSKMLATILATVPGVLLRRNQMVMDSKTESPSSDPGSSSAAEKKKKEEEKEEPWQQHSIWRGVKAHVGSLAPSAVEFRAGFLQGDCFTAVLPSLDRSKA